MSVSWGYSAALSTFIFQPNDVTGSGPEGHELALCWDLRTAFIKYWIFTRAGWLEHSIWFLIKLRFHRAEIFRRVSIMLTRRNSRPLTSIWSSFNMYSALKQRKTMFLRTETGEAKILWGLMNKMLKKNRLKDIRKRRRRTPDKFAYIARKGAEIDSPRTEEALQLTAKIE